MRRAALLSVLVLATFIAGQERAPARKPHPVESLALDAAVPWIADPETPLDRQRTSFGIDAKVDRTALLEQALQRARSEGKPVLWYVFRIVETKNLRGHQMYRAPVLDVYMRQVVFADPDVAGIVAARFVPLRLACDEKLAGRFGLRPLDVIEPMLVFLDGDGKVIHVVQRIRTFHAGWTAALLRRVLEKVETQAPPAEMDVKQAIQAGHYDLALATLKRKEERTRQERVLLASVLRRLCKPDEALAELDALGERANRTDPEVTCERGILLATLGRHGEALPLLEAAYRARRGATAQAGYWYALCLLHSGDELRARDTFERVATSWPDDPYGRKARANVTLGEDERPVGAAFAGFEHTAYLPAAAYAGLPRDTAWAGDPRSVRELAAGGVEFLLQSQRDHGGWTDSRYAYWPDPTITQNAWLAISAVCATALLEHRDVAPARIDAALQRAEGYLFDPSRLSRGRNEDVYADAYRLLYLARKAATAGPVEKTAAVARMNQVLKEAEARQGKDGFFAHEYPNAFATGAMLWSGLLARNAGAQLPEDMALKAVGALLSARFRSGAYTYGGPVPQSEREGSISQGAETRRARNTDEQIKNAAARMPLCEATLLAFGRSDGDKVQAAFDAYWKYMDRMEQVRRNDFHSDGELAGFFFFHGLFHASEANRLLPDEARRKNNQRFLEVLQRIPEMDGSFVDSHELGRSYGTAMALLTLRNVAE